MGVVLCVGAVSLSLMLVCVLCVGTVSPSLMLVCICELVDVGVGWWLLKAC